MSKFFLALVLCFSAVHPLWGQDIRKHYVSRSDGDGTIFHVFPCTLFESRDAGDLTFDVTYRDHRDGKATINFTYEMKASTPADSIRFVCGRTRMQGIVRKIYIEPEKKQWKHRYTFTADIASLYTFFDVSALPEAVLYCSGDAYVYKVKPAAWKTYAPIGNKTFGMIRVNEKR